MSIRIDLGDHILSDAIRAGAAEMTDAFMNGMVHTTHATVRRHFRVATIARALEHAKTPTQPDNHQEDRRGQ